MTGMVEVTPSIYDRLEVLKEYSDVVFEECIKYFKDTFDHVVVAILAYVCVCVVFYVVTNCLDTSSEYGQIKPVKRVLFVTAHPDDECMFFGPTIVKLSQRSDCELFLLCLSDGNYNNAGKIRKKELWDACKILGIPESNVTILLNQNLPDNPTVRWREEIVASYTLNQIETYSIDTVITFDRVGVSRHQNHISIYYAIAYLCMERKLPSYCRAYALESIHVLRKYSFFLDMPICFLLSSFWYIATSRERTAIRQAMKAHHSQYVWYRRLYMRFSRYTFINTLKEIEIVDLELDLELDD